MQYPSVHILLIGSLCAAAACLCNAPCHAETQASPAEFTGAESSDEPLYGDQLSKWFFVFGAANVYPRLELSEARINHEINGTLGRVFPRWNEPRTFRDWRNELRLWDFHVGFGRELTPKWVWMSTFGGTLGTVRNEDRYYPVGIPAMFHVDFSRKLWFASSGMLYYPWGQSVFEESDETMGRFQRSLKGSRPFVGGVVGYVDLTAEAVVKVDLPLTRFDPRIVMKERTRPFYVSPRVGVDVPITPRNDLVLAAGYLFFNEDPEDLNNVSIYAMFKHRLQRSGSR